MNQFPTHCARCGADLSKTGSIMSKFNQDTVCMLCKARECAHPDYPSADAAEVAAVRAGNYNYPGIGAPQRLFKPPCLAETVVIEHKDADLPDPKTAAARHNAKFVSDTALHTDTYQFPDGSVLLVNRNGPQHYTVLAYPSK